jgi:hypothetical protein
MHDPDAILAKALDFSKSAAVMFVAVLQYATVGRRAPPSTHHGAGLRPAAVSR